MDNKPVVCLVKTEWEINKLPFYKITIMYKKDW